MSHLMPVPIGQGPLTSGFAKEKQPLPSNVDIEPVDSITLPSYRRLIALLLPIRYPDKFYHDAIANTSETSLARVALWNQAEGPRLSKSAQNSGADQVEKLVIGGIQCRVEDVPSTPRVERQLYIQTLGVLAPYRQLGIATQLLEAVTTTAIQYYDNIVTVYAHVWEANEDALEWYAQRGFTVESEVIQGYYRKLKPNGGRVVRRAIMVTDHLFARGLKQRATAAPDPDESLARSKDGTDILAPQP